MSKALKFYFMIFFSLLVFGMVMVFDIKIFSVQNPEISASNILFKQLLNFILVSVAFLVFYFSDLIVLRYWNRFFIIVVILALIATAIFGTSVNGSKRWINLHFIMLQPSEFAKIAIVLYLAEVIPNKGKKRMSVLKELVYPFGLVGFIGTIIAIEDLGTALIILGTAMALFIVGGLPLKYIFFLGGMGVLFFVIMIGMKPYRIQRIKTFINPLKYQKTTGYQQAESLIALGRGGLNGVGFGNSERKMNYLPEASTDFIFSIIGEEFGFIGTSILVLAFFLLFWIGVYFALMRTTPFYFYVIFGFTLLLAIQVIINMGVVVSLLPNKGVPLPFISYGGSSLMSYSIMIAMIMNAVLSDSKF